MIRLSKSCIGENEIASVKKVLAHEYLGMGNEVHLFESELTSFFGREAICVANGTSALQLALQSAGIGWGDEVLVQSITYVASYQAISAIGATPVSCDVDIDSLTIDVRDAENKISSKTKAIMPVHYAGGVGNLDGIYAFAKRYGIRVVEDAAHAFGSKYKNKLIGSFGDFVCFSFDGIKNITSGEGGCVVTSDEAAKERIKDNRLLGVVKDTEKRYRSIRSWDFDVVEQGWRYHMSNVMAAIGIEQMGRFPEFSEKRKLLASIYFSELSSCSGLRMIDHDYTQVVPHIFVVILSSDIDRDAVRQKLLEDGVETGVHYKPNHLLSYYSDNHSVSLNNVESIYPCLLSLPLHPDLDEADVKYVCNKLINIVM